MSTTALQYAEHHDGSLSHQQILIRLRRQNKPDPYNPDRQVPTSWDQAVSAQIKGVLVAITSTEHPGASHPAALREDIAYTAQLIIDDPKADIQRGDRICLPDHSHCWDVQGFPQANQNPFTGWQPTLVCNLKEVRG